MTDHQEAEALFEEGRRALPAWNESDQEVRAARMAEGLAILERAFARGHRGAGGMVGRLLQYTDIRASYVWAVKLARLGDVQNLVSLLAETRLPPELGREVVAEAKGGAAWAQTAVALVYGRAAGGLHLVPALGLEATSHEEHELEWLERAVAQGWPPAQYWLALTVEESDPERAIFLAGEASREGPHSAAIARDALAKYVALLDDCDRPLAERIPGRERLAEGGHAESMVWVGDRYRTGEGVAQSFERARTWYERATEKLDAGAYRELGKMYEAGMGVVADDEKARAMYESAAEMGADPYARKRLVAKYGLTWYGNGGTKKAKATKPAATKATPTKPAAKKPAAKKPAAKKPAAKKAAVTKRTKK